jgi:hypothetical protein
MKPSLPFPSITLKVGDRIPLPSNEKIHLKYGLITEIDGDYVTVKTPKSTFYLNRIPLQIWVTKFLLKRRLVDDFLKSRVVLKTAPKYSDNYYPMSQAVRDAYKKSFMEKRVKARAIEAAREEKNIQDAEIDKLKHLDLALNLLPDRLRFKDKLSEEFVLSPRESDALSKKVFWDKFTNYDGANDDRDKARHALYMSNPIDQRKLLRKKKKSPKPKPKRKIAKRCKCK